MVTEISHVMAGEGVGCRTSHRLTRRAGPAGRGPLCGPYGVVTDPARPCCCRSSRGMKKIPVIMPKVQVAGYSNLRLAVRQEYRKKRIGRTLP